jgi:hypothetical protein
MDYQVTITPTENYLHVEVYGAGNYDNALKLWMDIAAACEVHQCFKILGEQQLTNTVSTMEAFDHPKIFKLAGINAKFRIAWVDKNPRTRETTAFIRNVLSNRSIGYGKLFSQTDDAKAWLLAAS